MAATESTIDPQQPVVALDDAAFGRACALTELPSGNPVSADNSTVVRYSGVIDAIWTIGKKLHGGTMVATSAAAAARGLRAAHPESAEMLPIAASTDFLGAPDPGRVDYEVRVRKAGRQICLVDVDLVQEGRTLVHTAFTFGRVDDAPPVYVPESHTDMPTEPTADAVAYGPDSPMRIAHLSQGASVAIDPIWARFLAGEQGKPQLRLWIRPRPADEQDPEVAVYFAMMAGDMSPPVSMNLGRFGWAPTVQLTTHLHRRPAPGWLRVIATTPEVGERMFVQDQLVLDATGAVIAQTRQLALIPLPR
ncbi:thioesterase family protein [Nocardia sp. NPDC046473]|uniref:thioesterase family protein n=1 Tax=Nocardia sp. NPDC046473 TaxID=3155733 RepID=UPI0033D652EC